MIRDGNGARMTFTYTFVWEAPQPNELGMWAQHWTAVAYTVHEAFQQAIEQTAGYEWGIKEGTSVLIVEGDNHHRRYGRAMRAPMPLKLDIR